MQDKNIPKFLNFLLSAQCIEEPTDENRRKLNVEINRVVAYNDCCLSKRLKALRQAAF